MDMSIKGTVPIFNELMGVFLLYYWALSASIFQVTPGLFVKVLPFLGIVSLIACTAWAATIFKSRFSILAFAVLLGFSACDAIYFNRPFDYPSSTLFMAMVMLCLTFAVEKNCPRGFGWAGFFAGTGLLTSYAFLTMLPLPILYLVMERLGHPRKIPYFRTGLIIFIVCAVLAAVPFTVSCGLDKGYTLSRLTGVSFVKAPELFAGSTGSLPAHLVKSLHESIILYATGQMEREELDVMGELTPLHFWMLPFVISGLWLALKKFRRSAYSVLVLWALLPIGICVLSRQLNARLFIATPVLYILAILPLDRLFASYRKRLACLGFVVLAAGTCYQAVHTRDINYIAEKKLLGVFPRDAAWFRAINNLVDSETEAPFYFTFYCDGACFDNPYVVKRKFMTAIPGRDAWERSENDRCCGDHETQETAFQAIIRAIRADTDNPAGYRGERFSLVFLYPDPCAEEILQKYSAFARPTTERFYHGVSTVTGAEDTLRVVELEIIAPFPLLGDPDDANRSDAS